MTLLSISVSEVTLDVGETQQLEATPSQGIKWKSSDPAIATVSGNGLVTGIAPGAATITAKRGGANTSTKSTVAVTVTAADVVEPPIEPPVPIDPDVHPEHPIVIPPVVPPIEPPIEPPIAGDRATLTAADLTFLGQQFVDLNYANHTFTIRYVNGERRFLFYQYDGWQNNRVGDLIEYRLNPAGLKNGEAHWTYDHVPELQEVRRWKNWHTRQRMIDLKVPNADTIFGGNGVWPSSFHWDEATGRLWYTWQPQYPGGPIIWPVYSAVTLTDAEAGGPVSDANVHGPYYFRDAQEWDDWAQAACGVIPIPAERHAAMGAKYLLAGHHKANVGSRGPRGLGLWSVPDLPATPGAPNATLWPGDAATLLYDTSPDTGAQPVSNMKLPNIAFQACGHASQGTQAAFSTGGGAPMRVDTPFGSGTAMNDAIYQHDYGSIDCIAITMQTPAAGGLFAPEIYNGTAWIQPPDWKMASGAPDLSGTENVFYWTQIPMINVDPDQRWLPPPPIPPPDLYGSGPLESATWVRLRRTQPGTTAGTIKAVVTSTGLQTGNEYGDRPLGKGACVVVGQEQYDAEHYTYAYEEIFWGGAWVRTASVEGLLYFGPALTGAVWYGGAPAWMQPVGGGVPVKRTYYAAAESFGNGGKSEGPRYPFFWTFSAPQLLELAAGTRERNGHGFQPEAFARLTDHWPGIIYPSQVANAESPYFGQPSFNIYGVGHSVQYDPQTQEVVLWMSNAAVWSGKPILAFFLVR